MTDITGTMSDLDDADMDLAMILSSPETDGDDLNELVNLTAEEHLNERRRWPRKEVEDLISLWRENINKFDSMTLKKDIFSNISNAMMELGYTRSRVQYQKKIQNLKATYQRNQLTVSETSTPTWRYYAVIHDILAAAPICNPDTSGTCETLISPDDTDNIETGPTSESDEGTTCSQESGARCAGSSEQSAPLFKESLQQKHRRDSSSITTFQEKVITILEGHREEQQADHELMKRFCVLQEESNEQMKIVAQSLSNFIAAPAVPAVPKILELLHTSKQQMERMLTGLLHLQQRKKRRREEMKTALQMYMKEVAMERVPLRKGWMKASNTGWWETEVPRLEEDDFMAHFRVDRETFEYICDALQPHLHLKDTNFRKAVAVDKQVAIALKAMASSSEYKATATLFSVGKATVYTILRRFIDAVHNVLVPRHISWPRGQEADHVAEAFNQKWQFPMAVGAIGACHFEIQSPDNQTTEYCNSQGWQSVMVLVVSDVKSKACYVKAGIPGRCSNSAAFKGTGLYKHLSERNALPTTVKVIQGVEVPLLLLGDLSFPLEVWLMKPFVDNGTLTVAQVNFNCRLNQARSVVENLFERTKGRWKQILRCAELKLGKVPKLITAAVCLNNICEERDLKYWTSWENENTSKPSIHLGRTSMVRDQVDHGDDMPNGTQIRAALMEEFACDQ